MTRRTIVVDSEIWKVYPTGRITVYGKDEFGLLFELGTGPERKRRFIRYSPLGSKSTDASLAELTERQLAGLLPPIATRVDVARGRIRHTLNGAL